MSEKQKYRVISPDGFDIVNGKIYNSKKEAEIAFLEWSKNYVNQGYYSSNKGRIPLDELREHMGFKPINIMYQSIAVIDLSIPSLTIYDVDENWSCEEIEEHLYTDRGHNLGNCSWGVFEGEINDTRNG